jgi:hypothetical protein
MTQGLVTHKSPSELVAVAPVVPGAFHQRGTSTPMVARPMRLSETEKRKIIKIVQRTLMEGYNE